MSKALSNEERILEIKARRDKKAHDHFMQYTPVWLVDEEVLNEQDAVVFNVVFLHPRYGWANRRYYYDAFTDVLYQKGQRLLDEAEALDIQSSDPYIEAPGLNTVLSYGG